jgi:hypothetical protein
MKHEPEAGISVSAAKVRLQRRLDETERDVETALLVMQPAENRSALPRLPSSWARCARRNRRAQFRCIGCDEPLIG